tara:strand:+ start:62 stop:382 length:321 start_codon:yes stop_codon:yes gene_type:complete
MNNLLTKLNAKFTTYIIDDIEIRIKSINYTQFQNYTDFAQSLEKDDERNILFSHVEYLLENFLLNSANERLIDSKLIKELPVDFLIKLLQTFNSHIESLFKIEKKV